MRPISEIILHCSATRPKWMEGKSTAEKVAEIRRWHVEDNGWRDIGYHFVIDRDGAIARGRQLEQIGAHTVGKNKGTIGICLIGGHGSSADDTFSENYTEDQDKAVRSLIEQLRKQYPAITKVTGHNDYAAKACPGFRVATWLRG